MDLGTGGLSPLDEASTEIGVFAGLSRAQGLPQVGRHPITLIVRAAARHRLTVLEVQLPHPPPVISRADLRWARLRIGLHYGDVRRLPVFLDDIRKLAWAESAPGGVARQAGAAGIPTPTGVIIAVQTVPEGKPRLLTPGPDGSDIGRPVRRHRAVRRAAPLVLASDLDVTTDGAAASIESPSALTWRVMAFGASWRGGVEKTILDRLDPYLELAGLTYTVLHGKAIALVLGHEPDRAAGRPRRMWRRDRSDETGAALAGDDRDPVSVYLDRTQSRNDLGHAERHALLRVHMHTPDHPGAMLV